jgi:AbrB family looped-hinge helix DNA binding protein
MKTTGIIRRIDDLVRIVIPKDIRNRMGINEGDSFEIFLNGKGIYFEKYYYSDEERKILREKIVKEKKELVNRLSATKNSVIVEFEDESMYEIPTNSFSYDFYEIIYNALCETDYLTENEKSFKNS